MKDITNIRSLIHTKYGSPEFLEIGSFKKPAVHDNDLLIRIVATTVNRTDCAMLRARPFIMRLMTGLLKPKKSKLGTDFAGIIEAVGQKVQTYEPGDRVFGFTDLGFGSHAEYILIPEDIYMSKIPDDIGFDQAAASLEGSHYAINIFNKVQLKKDQTVLVNGATGSIGSSLVQFLHYHGMDITATCKKRDFDKVKSLGATKLIDYMTQDFTKLDQQFDYVFDAVGKSSYLNCKPLLKKQGIYISSELGPMAQNLFFALVHWMFKKTSLVERGKKVIFPYPSKIDESLMLIKKLLKTGELNPLIDQIYPFEKIIEAYHYVETGEKLGNVVINFTKE